MSAKIVLTLFLLLVPSGVSFAQQKTIHVSEDIELVRITNRAYVHISYADMPPYGRVGSNGLLFVDEGKAFLFDTPVTESQTRDLVSWIQDTMKTKIVGFVPNHWHSDCMGGLAYINSLGIESYANEMTIQIARSKNLPLPKHGFTDSLILRLGDKKIVCHYPGPAHTLDNIVVWIPSEQILFAGCMVKGMDSRTLGNTADGDLARYPKTIRNVLNKYRNAKFVIPGHGQFGGIELLEHTVQLAENQ